MRRFAIALLISAGVVALIFGIWYFWSRSTQKEGVLTLYGNVDVRQVDIAFRVPGQVQEIYFEEGDFVAAGALMAILDKTPYDSELSEAAASVETIKVNLANAEKLLLRRQELIGVGGISQEDLDNATASRDTLLANLKQAEASLVAAQDRLSYTRAFAPTPGVILTRIREPGTVVNPSDPVYTLSISSPVWIRAFVDETNLGKIYYGMKAKIHTDSGAHYYGKIGFISPVAEFTPKTVETAELRTDLVYRLRIYADNPDHYLKQGMPVTVKLNVN
jgi:HlyD family secretion protein